MHGLEIWESKLQVMFTKGASDHLLIRSHSSSLSRQLWMTSSCIIEEFCSPVSGTVPFRMQAKLSSSIVLFSLNSAERRKHCSMNSRKVYLFDREVQELKEMIYECGQCVDVKPWTIEPEYAPSKIGKETVAPILNRVRIPDTDPILDRLPILDRIWQFQHQQNACWFCLQSSFLGFFQRVKGPWCPWVNMKESLPHLQRWFL